MAAQKPEHNRNIYLNELDRELVEEMEPFLAKYRISFGRMAIVCLAACWPTIKKELPKKRTFKLNDMEVTP